MKLLASWLAALLPVAVLAGCAPYRPRPLQPSQLEREYRGRTLSDAGLRAFIEANAPAKPGAWPPAVLDLQMLTLAAFYYSPELDLARAQVAAAEAGIVASRARANPSLASQGGFNTNPESSLLADILPAFTIETAGKRRHRIVHSQQQAEAARLGLAEAAWRLRSRVRAALIAHLLAQRRRDLLRAEEGIRAEIVGILDKRLAVGEIARPELDVFRVDLITTEAALQAVEGEVAQTRVALANAVGLPSDSLQGRVMDLATLETPPAEDALPLSRIQRAGLLHRVDVRRMLAEYAAAEAALRSEVARQYPNIQLGPGYSFEDGFARYVLGATIGALPVFHRNQGPIAAAEAQRQQVEARFAALQAQAIGEIDRALVQYRSALAEWRKEKDRLATQQQREEAARRALEAGEADRFSLATARLQTVAAQRARLDALLRVQTALGALEDAVQQPLDAPLPEPSPRSPRVVRKP